MSPDGVPMRLGHAVCRGITEVKPKGDEIDGARSLREHDVRKQNSIAQKTLFQCNWIVIACFVGRESAWNSGRRALVLKGTPVIATRSLKFVISLPWVIPCVYFACQVKADDQVPARTLTWSLRDEFQTGGSRQNPNTDRDGQIVWHFLRTTRSEGPVESRKWLRDGRYVPLADAGDKLFGSPLDGWAYRAKEPLAPAIGKLSAKYDIGLKFVPGDILIAPGPDHAVVVGWRSPVGGKLEI